MAQKRQAGANLGVANDIGYLVTDFGVKAKTQIAQVGMPAFDIPGEVVSDFHAKRPITADSCRLEKMGIDSVGFNDPALATGTSSLSPFFMIC